MAVASIVRDNMFYEDCKVFLEGIEVPVSAVSVTYGVASPPMCSLVLPSSTILRDLPERTKIHIFFRDLLPAAADANATPKYEWRLLFDGEYYGVDYATDANGTNITITGIHSTGYLDLMQVMTVDAAAYMFNSRAYTIGDAVIPTVLGTDRKRSTIIENILKGKTGSYKSMADIVYSLIKAILEGSTDNQAVIQFYQKRMTNKKDAGGWKTLDRIFNVDKDVKTMDPVRNSNIDTAKGDVFDFGKSKPGTAYDMNSSVPTGLSVTDRMPVTFPADGVVTGLYREDRASGPHQGVDIGTSKTSNTPVYAASGGKVTRFLGGGYGAGVEVQAADGTIFHYGHCYPTDDLAVGSTIKEGQRIAVVPAQPEIIGSSSGQHLHFSVYDAQDGTPVSPYTYLRR